MPRHTPELTVREIDPLNKSAEAWKAADLICHPDVFIEPYGEMAAYNYMARPETSTYGLYLEAPELNELLVGVASLNSLLFPPNKQLIYFGIHPDYQRGKRGFHLGRYFLQYLEREEQAKGVPGIILSPTKKSERFYSLQGYGQREDGRYIRIFPEIIDYAA